ncbi:MAG: peroxidase-related enzyme [Gemmatimonadetes bacterium]|nr:peroxidase-related enzyme [Gemmatimonadota bacterium]
MPFLPTLPDPTDLADVLQQFPIAWPALLDAHDSILRGPASLTIGERELIAAYVSGLNACAFCTAAHTTYAERYGTAPGVVDALLQDEECIDVAPRLRPVLAHVRTLTLTPARTDHAAVSGILAAGWPPETIMEVAMVVALFSFMNRIVLGMGVSPFAERYHERLEGVRRLPIARRLDANVRDVGSTPYRDYGRSLGLITD